MIDSKLIPPRGTVRVYFCGGTGVNVGRLLLPRLGGFMKELPYAEVKPAFIDTSRANLDAIGTTKDNCFLVQDKDIDGSGQIRRTNSTFIADAIPQIINHFEPAELNIVVSSSSGGSGSVIAPMIAGNLLKAGHQVIALTVMGANTYNEYENTINTFKSYAMVAQTTKTPIPMGVFRNSEDKKFSEINADVLNLITNLSVLFSRNNVGLDKADLKNWINLAACRVTNAPAVYFLNVTHKLVHTTGDDIPVSVATLAVEDMQTSTGTMVEYQTVGLIKEEYTKILPVVEPMHFVIYDGIVGRIVNSMTDKLQELRDAELNRKRGVDTSPIISAGAEPDVGGIVL